MNSRAFLYAACVAMCLALLPACSSKKKTTPQPLDDAALSSTEQVPGESLDKDVVGDDLAQPGEPLPTDADIPAAPAALPGSGSSAAASIPAQSSTGYPDYDTSSARPRSGSGGGGSYTVKNGDSLWSISRRNGTTVRALASANGISESAVLRPGRKLVIPSGSARSSKSSGSATVSSGGTYKVQRGDSYSTIAKRHHTTVQKLKDANGASSDALREGQTLKIP